MFSVPIFVVASSANDVFCEGTKRRSPFPISTQMQVVYDPIPSYRSDNNIFVLFEGQISDDYVVKFGDKTYDIDTKFPLRNLHGRAGTPIDFLVVDRNNQDFSMPCSLIRVCNALWKIRVSAFVKLLKHLSKPSDLAIAKLSVEHMVYHARGSHPEKFKGSSGNTNEISPEEIQNLTDIVLGGNIEWFIGWCDALRTVSVPTLLWAWSPKVRLIHFFSKKHAENIVEDTQAVIWCSEKPGFVVLTTKVDGKIVHYCPETRETAVDAILGCEDIRYLVSSSNKIYSKESVLERIKRADLSDYKPLFPPRDDPTMVRDGEGEEFEVLFSVEGPEVEELRQLLFRGNLTPSILLKAITEDVGSPKKIFEVRGNRRVLITPNYKFTKDFSREIRVEL